MPRNKIILRGSSRVLNVPSGTDIPKKIFNSLLRCVISRAKRRKGRRMTDLSISAKKEAVSFEEVRKRVFCKLINTDRNKDILKEALHMDFLDLSVVFYCFEGETGAERRDEMLITVEDARRWDMTTRDVMDIAIENTLMVLGEEIQLMSELINELMKNSSPEEAAGCSNDMFVLTNNIRFNGAVSMLIGSEMAGLSGRMDRDLMIIPSSIHEVILLPLGSEYDVKKIDSIIKDINRTELRAGEVLSDHAYFYDRRSGQIRY